MYFGMTDNANTMYMCFVYRVQHESGKLSCISQSTIIMGVKKIV